MNEFVFYLQFGAHKMPVVGGGGGGGGIQQQHHMVSLEEPRNLVQQLVTKFYPENDVAMIASIDQAHSKVVQARQRELAQSHEQLQGITKSSLLLIHLSSQCGLKGWRLPSGKHNDRQIVVKSSMLSACLKQRERNSN